MKNLRILGSTKLRKKFISILLIIFIFSQYLIVPSNATISSGEFTYLDFPFNKKEISFQKIATGGSYLNSFLGIDTDGNLWGHGDNSYGELGLGNKENIVKNKKVFMCNKLVFEA